MHILNDVTHLTVITFFRTMFSTILNLALANIPLKVVFINYLNDFAVSLGNLFHFRIFRHVTITLLVLMKAILIAIKPHQLSSVSLWLVCAQRVYIILLAEIGYISSPLQKWCQNERVIYSFDRREVFQRVLEPNIIWILRPLQAIKVERSQNASNYHYTRAPNRRTL